MDASYETDSSRRQPKWQLESHDDSVRPKNPNHLSNEVLTRDRAEPHSCLRVGHSAAAVALNAADLVRPLRRQ